MEGTVKFFNRKKGFGFIQGKDEKDYFVHFTAVAKGVFLRDNDLVSFDPAQGEKGLKADNVKLLQKGSEREGVTAKGNEEEPSEDSAESDDDFKDESSEEEEDEKEE